jgi:LPXTG-motif cell wall-anchored protein
MEELKDIKDIVEVHEYSFFILMGLTVFIVLLLSLAVYFFKNRRKRRKKITVKERALEKLKKMDFSDTKSVVYTFEEQGRLFLNEKNQEKFDSITKELTVYKYKKDIPPLDANVEKRIKRFIGELK